MKPASAKAKGRALQQWVRDYIIKVFPDLTIHDVRSASMGSNGMDVMLSKAAREKFPYAVEAKNLAQATIFKMYDQAAANAEGLEPIVVIRMNRRKPIVALDFEVFMSLVKDREANKDKSIL